MSKIFTKILLALCALFLLTGCEDASARVSNPNEKIATFDGGSLTKERLYEVLRAQDDSATVLRDIQNRIADKEIETTDDIKSEAQDKMDADKETYSDSFDLYMNYYGYENEDEMLNGYYIPAVKYDQLQDTYINENWMAIVDTYYPTQVQIMELDSEDKAAQALDRLKAGDDFGTVAIDLSTQSSSLYSGNVEVVCSLDEETLPSSVTDFIKKATGPSTSEALTNTAGTTYYIVKVVDKDVMSFKGAAVDRIKTSTDLSTEMMAYYYKKYNFHTYDVTLRDYLKENYPTYLNQ